MLSAVFRLRSKSKLEISWVSKAMYSFKYSFLVLSTSNITRFDLFTKSNFSLKALSIRLSTCSIFDFSVCNLLYIVIYKIASMPTMKLLIKLYLMVPFFILLT